MNTPAANDAHVLGQVTAFRALPEAARAIALKAMQEKSISSEDFTAYMIGCGYSANQADEMVAYLSDYLGIEREDELPQLLFCRLETGLMFPGKG